ncbi:MAG: DUF692 domain-containing protein [Pseudomonadales bacterium]|nr:DUF692 domain-containing protein [Pseudomonadales bacterium]
MDQNVIEGVGVGFRDSHFDDILEEDHNIQWFELLTENHLVEESIPFYKAEKIRENYPMTLHGVGMSLGSTDPLNLNYMKKLSTLINRLDPARVSDHLAWVSHNGVYSHELLPLPYTEETLKHLTTRINQAQDILGRTILIENPSSYLSFTHSEMREDEFLIQLMTSTGCDLLLDINNLYVSAINLKFDPLVYLKTLVPSRVKEIHLAGYEIQTKTNPLNGSYTQLLFDTHGHPVRQPVWQLYEKALSLFGQIPTLMEWDTNIPSFQDLALEASKAQSKMDQGMPLYDKTESLLTVFNR